MHQINLYTSCLNNTLILPKNEIRKFWFQEFKIACGSVGTFYELDFQIRAD